MRHKSNVKKYGTYGNSTKYVILNSAIDLFSLKGYAGCSVRDIARASGVTESALYNHFRNKAAVLTAIFDVYRSEIKKFHLSDEQINNALELYKPEKILELGLIAFQKSFDNPLISKITQIIILELPRNETARRFFEEESILQPRKTMSLLFSKMIHQRLIQNHDPEVLSCLYNSMTSYFFQELMLARLGKKETGIIRDKMHRQLDFLWKMIKI